MARQIFGQNTNSGVDDHNYMVVNDDGSLNLGYDADNPLSVEIPPLISAVNSTSTPLVADATFTGVAERCNGYGIIYVNTYSDQASATDGLKIEQSADGTNWDHCDEFSIGAGSGKNFSINPYAKWYRVRYTNGTVDQTDFRLQTILKATGLDSSHRIQDDITTDDDATLVKSVITAQDADGNFQNIKGTRDGDISISDNSSGLAIAQGNVTGVSNVNKFGNAPDFDTGDGEVYVWDGADDANENLMTYTFSTTADIDRLSSSSASDTMPIEVQGLDANYDLINQTITLTGQTPVALTTPLIRVFRLKNVGAVDIIGRVYCFVNVATTGGVPNTLTNIRALIDNGSNQTEMAIFTVPAGKTGYIDEVYASTAGGSRASNYIIKLRIRPFGQVFQLKHRRAINDNKDLTKVFKTPEVALEKSDIIMTAQAVATNITGSSVSAGFGIKLVDN